MLDEDERERRASVARTVRGGTIRQDFNDSRVDARFEYRNRNRTKGEISDRLGLDWIGLDWIGLDWIGLDRGT
jgi:hypothetical protein